MVSTDSLKELQTLLNQGARKIIITTIHKFGEAEGALDDRRNIIAMVDAAHRSQEGDYGQKMLEALSNAFLFGLTGTPINKRGRNTFMWFGSPGDEGGYLSRYTFQDSIRDGATLPLRFEPRLSEIHLDQEKIDAAFEELSADRNLTEGEKITLSKKAASIEVLIKALSRIRQVAADVVEHFTTNVGPEEDTAIIVSNVVDRIDEVVRGVRFDGWQSTIAGDQEVRKALRQTLYVQFKIRDNDVYEKALGYVREYY